MANVSESEFLLQLYFHKTMHNRSAKRFAENDTLSHSTQSLHFFHLNITLTLFIASLCRASDVENVNTLRMNFISVEGKWNLRRGKTKHNSHTYTHTLLWIFMIIKSVEKIFLLDSTIFKRKEYVTGDLKGLQKKRKAKKNPLV